MSNQAYEEHHYDEQGVQAAREVIDRIKVNSFREGVVAAVAQVWDAVRATNTHEFMDRFATAMQDAFGAPAGQIDAIIDADQQTLAPRKQD
jgi:hypothetical protein